MHRLPVRLDGHLQRVLLRGGQHDRARWHHLLPTAQTQQVTRHRGFSRAEHRKSTSCALFSVVPRLSADEDISFQSGRIGLIVILFIIFFTRNCSEMTTNNLEVTCPFPTRWQRRRKSAARGACAVKDSESEAGSSSENVHIVAMPDSTQL